MRKISTKANTGIISIKHNILIVIFYLSGVTSGVNLNRTGSTFHVLGDQCSDKITCQQNGSSNQDIMINILI